MNNLIKTTNTATILDRANKRQESSQLLLLAIVDKRTQTTKEIRYSLHSYIDYLKNTAQQSFYFDLGWLENINTILNSFSSLGWVEKHADVYQSTKIGRSHLAKQWKSLEDYFGISLAKLQGEQWRHSKEHHG